MRLQSNRQVEREAVELQFITDWIDWDEALSELTYQAEREWVQRAQAHINIAQQMEKG
jgi:hypothetical protein